MRSSASFIRDDDLQLKDNSQWFNGLRLAWRTFWNLVWYKNPDINFDEVEDSPANKHLETQVEKYNKKPTRKNRTNLATALRDAEVALLAEDPLEEAFTFSSHAKMFKIQTPTDENAKDQISTYQARRQNIQQKQNEFSEKFKKDEAAEKSRTISAMFLRFFSVFSPCKTAKPTRQNVVAHPAAQNRDNTKAPPRVSMT